MFYSSSQQEDKPQNPTWATALYDFDAEQAGDLALRSGDLIKVSWLAGNTIE